jgi:predicted nucleotide-binding protein
MELKRNFREVRFSAEAIQEALAALPVPDDGEVKATLRKTSSGNDHWNFDNDDEFYEEYRKGPSDVHYYAMVMVESKNRASFEVTAHDRNTTMTVQADTRAQVLAVMQVAEKYRAECTLAAPPVPPPKPKPPLVVFIGHGGSRQWRDLKDHLQDQQGYEVAAYEVGARAGHVVRDILEDMLSRSTFAILVMTGEDEQADGSLRARENVVHEAGLFQGRLGFSRAILLVEDGVAPFSNLQGVQQVRYAKGAIRETFGDVVATIRREFS